MEGILRGVHDDALIHVKAHTMSFDHGVHYRAWAVRAPPEAPKVSAMPHATAEDLRAMADWQRRWAELAGNEIEKRSRLELAACLDRMATECERGLKTWLAQPSPGTD